MNELLMVGKLVIQRLEEQGHSAYFVGGCVRDFILKQNIKDVDIATSALPEEVEALFRKTIPTGKRFGTITVVKNNIHFEVTTFRDDVEYNEENRHPIVKFSKTIEEDLKRRDFTINAIAMTEDLDFIDPFNGIKDIDNKILRTVGNPMDRFTEDPLRMLRLARFYGRFNGFEIEEETFKFINQDNLNLLNRLSVERIRKELELIFEYNIEQRNKSLRIISMILKDYHSIFKHLESIINLKHKLSIVEYYLILFHESNTLDNFLKLSNNDYNFIKVSLSLLDKNLDNYDIFITPEEVLDVVYNLKKLYLNEDVKRINRNSLIIKDIKDLKVSSEEIIKIIGKNNVKKVKDIQKVLVTKVLNEEVENNKKQLIGIIKKATL